MKSRTKHELSSERINQLKIFLNRVKLDQKLLLKNNRKLNFNILNEALTHSSANSKNNYEKLEFLGDAVLRLTASEFIASNYPNMNVGERSALRAQLVSDRWLTKVGQSIVIEKILIIGMKAEKDSSALATLQAEATEALIGAIYESCKDLELIHNWLYKYWQEESLVVLKDPNKHNSKSALQEWTQSKGLNLPRYEVKEMSKIHGDQKRFLCKVHIGEEITGQGWGGSRKDAEKVAANASLKILTKENN